MESFDSTWEDTWVNINGEFIRGPDATVPILDWGFIYGDGVFEGVAIAEGKVLKLEKHINRFYRSMKRVRIEPPLTKKAMTDRWLSTIKKNNIDDGYIRPLVSRGKGEMGISNYEQVEGPNTYIIPHLHRTPSLDSPTPVEARISSVRSQSPVVRDPRVKADHYIPNILSKIELEGTNATVPIRLDDDGLITEGAGANIFVVKDNVVSTPGENRILPGTTRASTIEVVKADDQLELEIQDLTPYDIYTADECFATATSTGVRAITHLNSSQIGDSDASPITEKINEKLREHLIATGTPIE